MNLCDFAEDHAATDVIFMLDYKHAQKTDYKRMFSVVDAVRLGAQEAECLIRKEPAAFDEDESEDSDSEVLTENVL
jgi:hypothetical protein